MFKKKLLLKNSETGYTGARPNCGIELNNLFTVCHPLELKLVFILN